uniref:Ribosome protein S8 n=1 Tax=Griffithsia japonica TaxID=83288 RepID=Q7XYA5_GRIJA|nr:ribosome protein S8 [Griffithsia japonica]|eukprot:GO255769.1.p1 GENE.GO255769.1~~GO255769.1.p1  ORF type:complete len:153 (-),score=1.46 GO255769.1:84-512(-)
MSRRPVLLRDPISDLFTRIRNGYAAKHESIYHPYSRFSLAIVKSLISQNYLRDFRIVPPESPRHPQFDHIEIFLSYDLRGKPAIRALRRVSVPSHRVYRKITQLPLARAGLGTWILSTPNGVMHCTEARQKRLGGEVIGEVF